MNKTEDTLDRNPGNHTLLHPAQVGRAGWSGSSIPGAPLNGDLPLTVRPRTFPKGQAWSRHRSVDRPVTNAQTGAARGTATAVHFFGCF